VTYFATQNIRWLATKTSSQFVPSISYVPYSEIVYVINFQWYKVLAFYQIVDELNGEILFSDGEADVGVHVQVGQVVEATYHRTFLTTILEF